MYLIGHSHFLGVMFCMAALSRQVATNTMALEQMRQKVDQLEIKINRVGLGVNNQPAPPELPVPVFTTVEAHDDEEHYPAQLVSIYIFIILNSGYLKTRHATCYITLIFETFLAVIGQLDETRRWA